MNHEQWEALKAATKGHAPRLLDAYDPEGLACAVFCAGWTDSDVALAAAAHDLLAEVERLREWLGAVRYFAHAMDHPRLQDICNSALNGAEVPK